MCELDSSTIEEAALQEAKQELASSEDGIVLLLPSEKEMDEFYRTRDYQEQDGIILHMEAQDKEHCKRHPFLKLLHDLAKTILAPMR